MKDKKEENSRKAQDPEAVVVDEVNATPAEDHEAEVAGAEIADDELSEEEKLQKENEKLSADLEKEKKEYMFLMAEFDNFRKRTLKEKMEIMKNGAEKAMGDILPLIDDFERALQAMNEQTDVDSLREGVELIYNKFVKYLKSNGVEAIDSDKAEFDTELHEAVANFPTPDEELKGKVIDTVQKGYKINDKVLRHAKVVVGQ